MVFNYTGIIKKPEIIITKLINYCKWFSPFRNFQIKIRARRPGFLSWSEILKQTGTGVLCVRTGDIV